MTQNRFKIATFNLYNLVSPNKSYYNQSSYNREDYEKKIDWIASQLGQMNADIVGFQEIFHLAVLQDALRRSGLYKRATVVTGRETGKNPVVGLVSLRSKTPSLLVTSPQRPELILMA